MLTRRGKAIVGLSALLVLVGRLLGVTELFGLAVAGFAVVAIGCVRVRSSRLRLSLTAWVHPPAMSVGDPALLELEVLNNGTVAASAGHLLLIPTDEEGPWVEVPRLVPDERASVSLRLSTSRRGRQEVTGFDAMLGDSLGVAQRRLASVGPTRYGVRPPSEVLASALPAAARRPSAELSDPGGFSHLRPYVPGDDLRRVHWPTTARVGDLVVRERGERETEPRGGVTVVLVTRCSTDTDGADFEAAVTAAASVLTAAAAEGPFRLVVRGGRDTGEARGAQHLDESLEALVDARPSRFGGAGLLPPGADDEAVVVVATTRDESFVEAEFGVPASGLVGDDQMLVLICTAADCNDVKLLGRRIVAVHLANGYTLAEMWASEPGAVVTV